MNVVKMRSAANRLFDEGRYDDAYYIYEEINNQIWAAIGCVQTGLTSFARNFLGNGFKSVYELNKTFINESANTVFNKWFNLDSDQTLNEFVFTTCGALQCICYSPNLSADITPAVVYNDFLLLHTLIFNQEKDDWINYAVKIMSPIMEDNYLKRKMNLLPEDMVKKRLIDNFKKIKSTDWFSVNFYFLDYLSGIGKENSDIYQHLHKIVGATYRQKSQYKKSYGKKGEKKDYKEYESYEKYEKYERYERFEKQTKTSNDFDPVTATEYEKAKYYGKLLGLTGKVTTSHIRKVYLNLIAQYHPDKVANLGPELVTLAERKTKEINAAYDWLKKKHNF
jgi:hypothetical protein